MPDTTDLLGFAIDKNPVDFASTFDELIRQKASIALENKKTELAQSIYGTPEEDLDDDLDLDDVDLEDFDLDDFDIDLEDLDLEDLDLDNLDGEEIDV